MDDVEGFVTHNKWNDVSYWTRIRQPCEIYERKHGGFCGRVKYARHPCCYFVINFTITTIIVVVDMGR